MLSVYFITGYVPPNVVPVLSLLILEALVLLSLSLLFGTHLSTLTNGVVLRVADLRQHYGDDGGGARRFVACSKAYASSIRRGSLQAIPVKLTPNGDGFGLKPAGNGVAEGGGALGTVPNGTITVG